VWGRQAEFVDDASLGAPPDAFNASGQDWGLPPYRWDVMAQNDFTWLRRRVARAAALADAIRIDHVVGFYRMFVIPPEGPGSFVPAEESDQLALGERLLRVVLEAAAPAAVIGEDLGVIPDFVRASLARLEVAGYRVLRWESDAGRFRDPAGFPACSLATTGTHDTSALAAWWTEELDDVGRRALAEVPGFHPLRTADGKWTPAVHTGLLEGLYGTGSDLVVLPFPDSYGGRERINLPATVGEANWSYRLPWTLERLEAGTADDLRARLAALAGRHERTP
jgi:4-alpha-glucanotransferase